MMTGHYRGILQLVDVVVENEQFNILAWFLLTTCNIIIIHAIKIK